MNKFQKKRLILTCGMLGLLGIAAGFILLALKQNMNAFLTPTQLSQQHSSTLIRLGGLVEKGSVFKNPTEMRVTFTVTDFTTRIVVHYQGILPDLFREGKGVIVEGQLNHGIFMANTVLAKHDENYVPVNQRKIAA